MDSESNKASNPLVLLDFFKASLGYAGNPGFKENLWRSTTAPMKMVFRYNGLVVLALFFGHCFTLWTSNRHGFYRDYVAKRLPEKRVIFCCSEILHRE